MYFMTSPATAMTMALEMMDEAAREAHGRTRGPSLRARRAVRISARRAATESAEQPARRGWRIARAFHLAH